MRFQWRALRPGELDFELIWLCVTVASAACGAVWLALHLPLPQCTFRALTGVPCVTCGATRAVDALLQGDVVAAWRLNPLVSFGVAVAAIFDVYAFTVLAARARRLRVAITAPIVRRVAIGAGCGAILLNWAYLLRQ